MNTKLNVAIRQEPALLMRLYLTNDRVLRKLQEIGQPKNLVLQMLVAISPTKMDVLLKGLVQESSPEVL